MIKSMIRRWLYIIDFIGLLIILGVCLWLNLNRHVNLDVAWFIYTAEQMLNGAVWGREILDINAPLIAWFYLPMVWMIKLFSGDNIFAFKVFMTCLTGLILILTYHQINRIAGLKGSWESRGLLLWLAFAVTIGSGYDFGQREHIAAIFSLPYLFNTLRYLQGAQSSKWMRIITTGLAGLGFLLKPYYLLVAVGIELYVISNIGWRKYCRSRFEPIIIIVLALVYLLTIVWFTEGYISFLVKFVGLYLNFDHKDWLQLVWQWVWLGPFLGAGYFYSGKFRHLSRLLTILTLIFLAVYILQQKGWGYHTYPLRLSLTSLFLILVFEIIEYLMNLKKILLAQGWIWLSSLVLIVILIYQSLNYTVYVEWLFDVRPYPWYIQMTNFIEKRRDKIDSLYFVSTYSYPGFPLVNEYNLRWGSRVNCLCYFSTADKSTQVVAKEVVDLVMSDLSNSPPDLLVFDRTLIDPRDPAGSNPQAKEFWNDARLLPLLSQYRYQSSVYSFDLYDKLK